MSYYRKFIPNFFAMMAPFSQLIKQKVIWKWKNEMTTHFNECKNLFRNDMLLINPDLRKPFTVYVDRSGYGLGAALVQNDEAESERVVTFASRSLIPCERNYSTTELECLSIIFTLSKFRSRMQFFSSKCLKINSNKCWKIRNFFEYRNQRLLGCCSLKLATCGTNSS